MFHLGRYCQKNIKGVPMNICLINPFSKLAAIRQYNLAKCFAELGHKVTLILPEYDKYSGYKKNLFEECSNLTIIHPYQIQSKCLEISMVFYFFSALHKIKNKKFDLVHGFRPTPFSGYLGYKISKKKKIPFILEMGDEEWQTMETLKIHPNYRVKIVKALEKKLIDVANGITTMSPSLAIALNQKYDKEIVSIPSGIDVDIFSKKNIRPHLQETLQKKTGMLKNMLYLGKLDKTSHILDSMYALKKVKNLGFIIVGDGKGKKDLEELAKKLDVIERCHFVGRIEHQEVPHYLNTANILVAPFSSSMAGAEFVLNLKILEYMGMEKPIIVSGIGILKEILKDCAFVYQPGNVDQFVEKINFILEHQEESITIATKARNKILDYDWKKQAIKMLNYYNKTITKFNQK
jgi:glycosyltransferase involved in cell wall biosynthesis